MHFRGEEQLFYRSFDALAYEASWLAPSAHCRGFVGLLPLDLCPHNERVVFTHCGLNVLSRVV